MTEMPRPPRHIERVVGTIWHESGKVKCPICAGPMERHKNGYIWDCNTLHCPITTVAFNERIHNYGVAENAPSDPR